ncbi:hypothetical protein OR573_04685 [Halomonas sp. CH40]
MPADPEGTAAAGGSAAAEESDDEAAAKLLEAGSGVSAGINPALLGLGLVGVGGALIATRDNDSNASETELPTIEVVQPNTRTDSDTGDSNNEDDGVVTFSGTATGPISIDFTGSARDGDGDGENELDGATLSRGGANQNVEFRITDFTTNRSTGDGDTVKSLRIRADDGAEINFSGQPDSVEAVVFDINDVQEGKADRKNLTLNTTGMGDKVQQIIFSFEDNLDFVVISEKSDLSNFNTIEVQKGTADLRSVRVADDVEYVVNSEVVLTYNQFVTATGLVSSTGLGRLTLEVDNQAQLEELVTLLSDKIIIGFGDNEPGEAQNITIEAAEGADIEQQAIDDVIAAIREASFPSVTKLTGQLRDLEETVSEIRGDESNLAAGTPLGTLVSLSNGLAALSSQLDTLTGDGEGSVSGQIASAIGQRSTESSAATGLWADIEALNSTLVSRLEAQIDALDDDLQAQIDGNDSDITGNATDLGELQNALSALEGLVGDNATAAAENLASAQNTLQGAIDTLAEQLNTSVSNLQGQIDGNDSDIAGNAAELGDLQNALSALESVVGENATAAAESLASAQNTLQSAIDTLAEQLNTSVSNLQGQIDGNDSDIAGNAAELGELQNALSALESVVGENATAAAESLASAQNTLQGAIDTLAEQLDSSVNDLQGQIDGNDTDIAGNVTKLDELQNALSALEGLVGDNATAAAENLASAQNTLQGAIDTLAEQLNTSVSNLQGQIDGNDTDIAGNVTKLDELQNALSALESVVGENATAAAESLASAQNTLQSAIDTLAEQLNTSVSNLQGQIDGNDSDIAGNAAELGDLQNALSALESVVGENATAAAESLASAQNTLQGAIDALAEQLDSSVNDLQGQIDGNDTDIAGNVTKLDELQNALSALEGLVGDNATAAAENLASAQNTLQGAIDTLAEQLNTSVSNLQGQIDGNDTDIAGNVTKLNNLTTLVGIITDAAGDDSTAGAELNVLQDQLAVLQEQVASALSLVGPLISQFEVNPENGTVRVKTAQTSDEDTSNGVRIYSGSSLIGSSLASDELDNPIFTFDSEAGADDEALFVFTPRENIEVYDISISIRATTATAEQPGADGVPSNTLYSFDNVNPQAPVITSGEITSLDATHVISGTAEAGAEVTLLIEGEGETADNVLGTVVANQNGQWSITALLQGENTLKAIALDPAGNPSTASGASDTLAFTVNADWSGDSPLILAASEVFNADSNTFSDDFTAQIAGYNPTTIPLQINGELTLEQAVAIAQAGLDNLGETVATAINTLKSNLQAQIDGNEGDIATNAAELGDLQNALTALEGLVGDNATAAAENLASAQNTLQGAIDALAEQLNSSVNDLQGQINGNDSDIAGNAAELSDLQNALSALEGLVGDNATAAAENLASAQNTLQGAIDALAEQLNSSVNDLQGQINGNDSDIAGNAAELSDLQNALSALEGLVGDNATAAAENLASAQNTLQGAIDALAEQLNSSVNDLQGQINGNDSDIAGNAAELGDLQNALSALEGLVGDNAATAAENLASAQNTLQGAIDALAEQLNTSVSNLQGQINGNDSDIAGNAAELGDLQNALSALEGLVGDNATAATENLASAQNTLQGAIDALAEQLNTSVSNLQGQISQLDQELQNDVEDLEAVNVKLNELNETVQSLQSLATGDFGDVQTEVEKLLKDVKDLQPQIDDIVKPELIQRNELDNRVELDEYESTAIRVELGEGDDFLNSSDADTEIVGGLGADTINLTYVDESPDKIVYQSVNDGKVVPKTTLNFSDEPSDYREGSQLNITINGKEYTYTVSSDDGDTDIVDDLVEDELAKFKEYLVERTVQKPDNTLVGIVISNNIDGFTEILSEGNVITQADLAADGSYTVPSGNLFITINDLLMLAMDGASSEIAAITALKGGGDRVYLDQDPIFNFEGSFDPFDGALGTEELPLLSLSQNLVEDLLARSYLENVLEVEDYSEATADQRDEARSEAASKVSDYIVGEGGALTDIRIDGNTLTLYGQAGEPLDVAAGGENTAAIVNNGLVTRFDVTFPDQPEGNWPTETNGDNTTEFTRKLRVNIDVDGVTTVVAVDVVYDVPDNPDNPNPVASVEALAKAVKNTSALDGVIEDVMVDGLTMTFIGAQIPGTDDGAPTFTVDSAAIDQNGVQQETVLTFSENGDDYYEGGTLSATIAGETITADMVAGSAAESLAALQQAINDATAEGGVLHGVLESAKLPSTDINALTVANTTTQLILTAATEEPDPLEATAALSFPGEAQQATFSLENAEQYDQLSDGTWVDGAEVYFNGGKAYVTITPTDGGDPITVSAEMQPESVRVDTSKIAPDAKITNIGAWQVTLADGSDANITNAAFSVSDKPQTLAGMAEFFEEQPGIASADITGAVLLIKPEFGVSIVPPNGKVRFNDDSPTAFVGQDVLSSDEMTSQALVDEINKLAEGTPAQVVIKAEDFESIFGEGVTADSGGIELSQPASSYLNSLSVALLDPEDGYFTTDFFQVTLTDGSYTVDTSGSIEFEGSVPDQFTGVKGLVDFLNSVGIPNFEAGTNEDGDLVLSSLEKGANQYLTFRIETPEGATFRNGVGKDFVLEGASLDDGTVTLTAAEPGKQTFEISDVTLDYQGVKQKATFSLDTTENYTQLSDGTDLTDTGIEGAPVYYEGGKAYVTIKEEADANATLSGVAARETTVSVDMTGLVPPPLVLTLAGKDSEPLALNMQADNPGRTTFNSAESKREDVLVSSADTLEEYLDDLKDTNSIESYEFKDGVVELLVSPELISSFSEGVTFQLIQFSDTLSFGGHVLSASNGKDTVELSQGASLNSFVSADPAAATSQALVDEINKQITGVVAEAESPKIVIKQSEFEDVFGTGAFDLQDVSRIGGSTTGGLSEVLNISWSVDGEEKSFVLEGNSKNSLQVDLNGFDLESSVAAKDDFLGVNDLVSYLNDLGLPDGVTAQIDDSGNFVLTNELVGSGSNLTFSLKVGDQPDTLNTILDEQGSDETFASEPNDVLSTLLEGATLNDDGEIILTSKDKGQDLFEVSDVSLDYQGVKQIATAEFSTDDADYYADGELAVMITPQGENGPGAPVTVKAAMAPTTPTAEPLNIVANIEADDLKNVYLFDGDTEDTLAFELKIGEKIYGREDFDQYLGNINTSITTGGSSPYAHILAGWIESLDEVTSVSTKKYNDDTNPGFEVSFKEGIPQASFVATAGLIGTLDEKQALDSFFFEANTTFATSAETALDNLLDAINAQLGTEGDLSVIIESVAQQDGKLTFTAAEGGVNTFDVTDATLSVEEQTQQASVNFSSDDADYFGGGTLGLTVNGEEISVDMIDSNAAGTLDALNNEIDTLLNPEPVLRLQFKDENDDVVDIDGNSNWLGTFTLPPKDENSLPRQFKSSSDSAPTLSRLKTDVENNTDLTITIDETSNELIIKQESNEPFEVVVFSMELVDTDQDNQLLSTKTEFEGDVGKSLIQKIGDATLSGGEDGVPYAVTFTAAEATNGYGAINITEASLSVEGVRQVTEVDVSSVAFEDDRMDAEDNRAQVSLEIDGTTISADSGADKAETLTNLKQAILNARDGSNGATQAQAIVDVLAEGDDAVTISGDRLLVNAKDSGEDPLNVGSFSYEVEDPEKSSAQKVSVLFDDSGFNNLVAEDTITLTLGDVTLSYTVTDNEASETLLSAIVEGLKQDLDDNHSNVATATISAEEFGFTPLNLTATRNGADVLGDVSEQEIKVRINDTIADGFYLIREPQAGDLTFIDGDDTATINDETGEGSAATGRAPGVLSYSESEGDGGSEAAMANDYTFTDTNGNTLMPAPANEFAGTLDINDQLRQGIAPGGTQDQRWTNPGDTVSDNASGANTDPTLAGDTALTGEGEGATQTFTNPENGYTQTAGELGINGLASSENGNAALNGDPAATGEEGVNQTVTNPDSGYDAKNDSPATNENGTTEGDSDLFGSDPGQYVDDGLETTYLSGGTDDNDDGTYESRDDEELNGRINIADGSTDGDAGIAGENATEDAVSDDAIAQDDKGFAPFDWGDGEGEAQVTVVALGNEAPDVVHNFQLGQDVIQLEGALLESTVEGDVSAISEYNSLDLSTTEFASVSSNANQNAIVFPEVSLASTLSTPTSASVAAAELGDAEAVATLLNELFSLPDAQLGSDDNGELNTTLFAVTASDDASQTAIWAHTQSSSDDATIEGSELNQLALLHTLGDDDFGSSNWLPEAQGPIYA